VDAELLRLAGEEYRKIRNTIRFLLSNLGDYDDALHRRELTEADACSIDAWAMEQLDRLIESTRSNYEAYRVRGVHDAIFNFCNETLSAVYMAAAKDRLYCDRLDADRRRRTQTVMHDIAEALIHLVAPVLVHTADEAFLALRGENPDKPQGDDCVHLRLFPEASGYRAHPDWARAMGLRDRVLKCLEVARDDRGLANPLDAGVRVGLPAEEQAVCKRFEHELVDLCGVSRFVLAEADAESIEIDDLSDEPRCERSWKRDGTVKPRSDGGLLTDRDADAVGV
jgi:isoleucyl-tRNA synthetase